MNLKFLIHSTYDAFLSNQQVTSFTCNPKGAKQFITYGEAKSYAENLKQDKKLTEYNILALPIL